MSFLTPLYLFGALAVGLPILFHMIRRTPRGRREFSSVMFLEPSPPRITRRSRIEHWLLLVLRALAVLLLAIAFSRPFLRVTQEQVLADGETRDFVLLLDTSASMRREGVWTEAVARMEELLDGMQPSDRVSLISFDTQPRVLAEFHQWTALDPVQRVAAAKTALREISPTWAATHLGRALIEAAERLDAETTRDEIPRSRMIVVVSDLQEGSRLEALQAYQWPPQIVVRLETVGADTSPNNAGVQPFVHSETADANEDRVRVRVTNATNSRREQFTLRWVDEFTEATLPNDDGHEEQGGSNAATAVTVIVPPGQSRAVSAPPRPIGPVSSELVLEGDDHDFDNRCTVSDPVQRTVSVAILSDLANDDPLGLWYYVERALVSTPDRAVEISPLDGSLASGQSSPAVPDLIIIAATPSLDETDKLRAYLEVGGTVLFVPVDHAGISLLYELCGIAPVEATEAVVDNYSMLTDIDYSHPLFAALDHPRYSDFTKVRFWKHRTVDSNSLPDARVLARFDDGDLAIGEIRIGAGRLVLFTSGWHPDDSQLALSTKFVPMLNGLLDSAAGIVTRRDQYVVGDTIDLTIFTRNGGRVIAVMSPEGEEIAVAAGTTLFTKTDHPGRYHVRTVNSDDNGSADFVVNLDPAESRTAPLPLQSLAAANVNLIPPKDAESVSAGRSRQLRGQELEKRQKFWRWLLVAAIFLLLGETWLASRTDRSGSASVQKA